MNKSKPDIIATNVTTLDEARYFAAMGADWLGFNLQRVTPDDLKQICDWVVGPKVFVEADSIDSEVLFKLTETIDLNCVCVPSHLVLPEWYRGDTIIKISSVEEQVSIPAFAKLYRLLARQEILPQNLDPQCYPDISPRVLWIELSSPFQNLNTSYPPAGFVIRCKEDNATPDNPFEYYDLVLEQIQDKYSSVD